MINLGVLRCLLIKADAHKTYFKTYKAIRKCEYVVYPTLQQ